MSKDEITRIHRAPSQGDKLMDRVDSTVFYGSGPESGVYKEPIHIGTEILTLLMPKLDDKTLYQVTTHS